MKKVQLWVRRVTMEIVVRAPDIQRAESLTEDMVNAAIELGREMAVYGDVEATAFVEFDDSVRPLVEKTSSEPAKDCCVPGLAENSDNQSR